MKIIGFQSGHDVSYCVLKDGVPVIHNEWERFLRKKEPQGDGLKFLFTNEANSEHLENVDCFTHGNPRTRYGVWAHRNNPETGEFPCNEIEFDGMMRSYNVPYMEVSHHLSHAANAFFSSNFDTALILTLDGGGWEISKDYADSVLTLDVASAATCHMGIDNKIKSLSVLPAEQVNIGILWTLITRDVLGLSWGYPGGNAAGTLMAMAAYGDITDEVTNLVKQLHSYSNTPREKLLIKKLKEYAEADKKNPFNITASLQAHTEVSVKNFISYYKGRVEEVSKIKITKLCIAGGVALNSVCVGKMYDWFPDIEEIYIPPIPYDSGLAIGSAQYVYHHMLDNPRVDWNGNASPYLGKTYSKEDVMDAVNIYGLMFEEVTDDDVIELISKDDNVVSVFGGGSESGRRALGNRSILADPRSKTMKAVINEKVKHRQSFRPFAPSILREEVSNWFVRDVDSPYMSCVINFKEEVADKVPAVCHVDNSARLQTVTEQDNSWYYNFIKKFGDKTGVPILLNTSFNDREPIVETPDNAITCFQKTDIDYLYFFDYGILIKKQ